MKEMRFLVVLISLVITLHSNASKNSEYNPYHYDFCVDGLYYQYATDEWGDVTKDKVRLCSIGDPSVYSGVIEIPESVEYDGITSIVVDAGYDTFKGCVLEKVVFPSTISCISGFYEASVKEVVIPEGAEYIGQSAFQGCKNLKTLHLPKSIKNIESNAFADCDIEEINFENIEYIGGGAFSGSNLKNADLSNLKGAYVELGVLEEGLLATDVFAQCEKLENVILSEAITVIDGWAFRECENLTKVEMPSVIDIWGMAFYQCSNLSDVDLSNVQTIGEAAFYGCSNLSDVDLSNVQTIGDNAFYKCSNLSDIDITNVQTIGEAAFYECSNLSEIDFYNVQTIGKNAFYKANGLTEITFYENLKEVGKEAFAFCENLKRVDMSRVYCDDYKYQLKIDEKCFYYCSNLEEVLFSETTASIGYRAFDYTSLEILELPEGLRFFGEDFISNPEPKPGLCVMKNLKSFIFPISCFKNYPHRASCFAADFTASEELVDIVAKFIDPSQWQLIHTTFNPLTYEKATLRVPVGTADLYRQCDGWKEFKNIVEDPNVFSGVENVQSETEDIAIDGRCLRVNGDPDVDIKIYDISGKCALEVQTVNGIADLSDLSSGLYIAVAKSSKGNATKKFILHD